MGVCTELKDLNFGFIVLLRALSFQNAWSFVVLVLYISTTALIVLLKYTISSLFLEIISVFSIRELKYF